MLNNHDGCDALTKKVTYYDRKAERSIFHKTGMPWWTSNKSNLILVPIFSAMDGTVLYSIFDESLTQSVAMGIIMAFGVAVVLNILPLIIARFVHAAFDRTAKNAGMMAGILIAGFVLIYGATVYLRFAYSDMYGKEAQFSQLENTVSDEEMIEDNDSSSAGNKGRAVVILLSISPLITSLLGFAIAYVSDDETRKKIECLEKQQIEIEEKIADTQAAIAQIESYMNEGIKRDLDFDKKTMDAEIEEIISRCDVLKAAARFYLAEYLADPSATSKLSHEMMDDTRTIKQADEIMQSYDSRENDSKTEAGNIENNKNTGEDINNGFSAVDRYGEEGQVSSINRVA